MRNFQFRLLFFSISSFFVFFAWAEEAHAYIDPGAGSILLQMLLAGLLGTVFTVKMYWKKCKKFFKNLTAGKNKENDD